MITTLLLTVLGSCLPLYASAGDTLPRDWEGAVLGTSRDSVLALISLGEELVRQTDQSTSDVEIYQVREPRKDMLRVRFFFYRDTLALVEEKRAPGLDYYRQLSSRYTQRFGPFTGNLTTAWRRDGSIMMILRYDQNDGFNYVELCLSRLRERIYQERKDLHSAKQIKIDAKLMQVQDSLRVLEKKGAGP
jgi:hypothetical protein